MNLESEFTAQDLDKYMWMIKILRTNKGLISCFVDILCLSLRTHHRNLSKLSSPELTSSASVITSGSVG